MNESDWITKIFQPALAEAQRIGATRLTALNIVIDDEGMMRPDQVRVQFETWARGTLAEGARVKIDFCASERHCWSCKTIFLGRGFDAECPECGSPGLRMARTPTVYLDSIEVECPVQRALRLPPVPAAAPRPHGLHRRRRGQ